MSNEEIDALISGMENMKLTKSIRGGDLLIYKNFEYKVDYRSKSSEKISWRCNELAGCLARVYTSGLKPPVYEIPDKTEHSHAAKPSKIEVRCKVNVMKENRLSDSGNF